MRYLSAIVTYRLRLDQSSFAPAEEINEYFIDVAKKYGLYEHIQFDSQISGAVWDEEQGRWSIDVVSKTSDEHATVLAEVFINASGILNDWRWPDIDGLSSFGGKLIHTASWVRFDQLLHAPILQFETDIYFRITLTGQARRSL